MWHDYHESEDAMVSREDYDSTVEELGETLVANQVLQAEVEAWKHTTARSIRLLNELLHSLQLRRPSLPHELRAEALLRELGVYWALPADERSKELDDLLRNVPIG